MFPLDTKNSRCLCVDIEFFDTFELWSHETLGNFQVILRANPSWRSSYIHEEISSNCIAYLYNVQHTELHLQYVFIHAFSEKDWPRYRKLHRFKKVFRLTYYTTFDFDVGFALLLSNIH